MRNGKHKVKWTIVALCVFTLLSCNPHSNMMTLDYMNDTLGAESSGDNLVILSEGNEERIISNTLISVFQEKNVAFIDPEPSLKLLQGKEYTTDNMTLTDSDIIAYNQKTTNTNNKLRVGPNYSVYFKVYYVVDETELRFRIKSFLQAKGLGQADYKPYKKPYSSKYFFDQFASKLQQKLKAHAE